MWLLVDGEDPEPSNSWCRVCSMTTLSYRMQKAFSHLIGELTESRRGSWELSQGR